MSTPAVRMYGLFPSMNPGRGAEHMIEVSLLWDSLNPEVVHVGLLAEGADWEPVRWLMEREMLAGGINRAIDPGGDVQVRPALDGKRMIVTFGAADLGRLAVHLRIGFVAEFIERTVRHTPLGVSSSIETAPWWSEVAS